MHHIATSSDIDQLLGEPLAVLYKHSPTCSLCNASAREVEQFRCGHPDVPLYQVDVLAMRALSRDIAARTGITHESPQIILLRGGTPLWHASHFAVTATDLTAHYDSACAGAPAPPSTD